ncbi:MAG TPA: glycosyltransferase [Xanthobacteraceae bacterium]|nr:glycosyltransferase [Xanthobacteraceae bacterium]
MLSVLAGIPVLIWIYLILARGNFWTGSMRDQSTPPVPNQWPAVAVVIPARDEADFIGASVGSLLRQQYSGPMTVIVVDDDSGDGTAAVARNAAKSEKAEGRVTVISSHALPPGWTGKLWALSQGIEAAEAQKVSPDYILLADADIVHAPGTLAWLVSKAEAEGLVLTSFLAKLRCESLAERMHVPAFVFFFQMLFPFAWVRRPDASTAAAAGGCMLVRADALQRSGGIESIRNALIDDCALARQLKSCGAIWLGLTDRIQSLRSYDGFAEVERMISRSAYAQLRNSPLLLAFTIAGMMLTFIIPPLFAVFGSGMERYLGILAWAAMALAFQPTLRFYGVSPLWGLALPGIALLYAGYTLDSAYRHWAKRGGLWKGRVYADAPSPQ